MEREGGRRRQEEGEDGEEGKERTQEERGEGRRWGGGQTMGPEVECVETEMCGILIVLLLQNKH